MNQLIIVEGPDRSGKTTLGKFIANATKGIYIHASGHKTLHPGMQAYHESILHTAKWARDQGHMVVIDRLWPSESIYGELMRPQHPGHLAYDYQRIRGFCVGLKARYIFCLCDDAVERHRRDPDHTHPYTDEQFKHIARGYRYLHGLLSGSGVEPTIKYDVNEQGSDLRKYIGEAGII